MTTPPKQYPRVWVHIDQERTPKATFFVAKHEQFDGIEFLSKQEHDALLREAKAQVWEEIAEEFHKTRIGSFTDLCRGKAAALRKEANGK